LTGRADGGGGGGASAAVAGVPAAADDDSRYQLSCDLMITVVHDELRRMSVATMPEAERDAHAADFSTIHQNLVKRVLACNETADASRHESIDTAMRGAPASFARYCELYPPPKAKRRVATAATDGGTCVARLHDATGSCLPSSGLASRSPGGGASAAPAVATTAPCAGSAAIGGSGVIDITEPLSDDVVIDIT
jgi:hypothetical protein